MDIIKRAMLGDCTGTLSGFDYIECQNCFFEITDVSSHNLEYVRKKWNSRPQLLTDEEMEKIK